MNLLKYYECGRGAEKSYMGETMEKRVAILSKTLNVILIPEVQRRELPRRCLA